MLVKQIERLNYDLAEKELQEVLELKEQLKSTEDELKKANEQIKKLEEAKTKSIKQSFDPSVFKKINISQIRPASGQPVGRSAS